MPSRPLSLREFAIAHREAVEHLDKLIPPRCIQQGETVEDAHRYAGKRELVDELLSHVRAFDARTAKANRNP